MSDIETNDPEVVEDDEFVEDDGVEPSTGGPAAVYPELDGEGGTKWRTGAPMGEEPQEASYADWLATNAEGGVPEGVTPEDRLGRGEQLEDDEALELEEGSPNPDDPNYNP